MHANKIDGAVMRFIENKESVFVDDKVLAKYNPYTNAYHAFDITDSDFPELDEPKRIYDDLERKYMNQELVIEKNLKDLE
jgi:hypothetical protein